MLSQAEPIHLLELCEDDPEFANQLVKNAGSQPRREYHGIPSILFVSRPLVTSLLGRLIVVRGAVIRTYETLIRNVTSEQRCMECNTSKMCTEAETRERERRLLCETCGSPHVRVCRQFEEAFQSQTIRIQDITNSAAMAETIEVQFEGEHAGKYAPGDKLRVAGILARRWKPVRANEPIITTLYVQALSVTLEQSIEGKDNSGSAELFIASLPDSSSHSRRSVFLDGFAPELVGSQHVKLAILLALLSGNPGETRSNIHLLLVGGQATGKTLLLRAAASLVTPSVFVNGAITSEAGLTSYAVRQGREWAIEAGALALSDRGVCCIDEFGHLRVSAKGGLLEAMEQQRVSVAKAGIVTSLSTRCSVIAAMRVTPTPLAGLSTPLLSRFDFIFRLEDDLEDDSRKCEAVLSRTAHKKATKPELAGLRAYLAKARTGTVKINEKHSEIARRYYTKRRERDGRNEFNTVRMLESLVRVAVAHAKLMGHSETEDVDIYSAIILAESRFGADAGYELRADTVFSDPEMFIQVVAKIDQLYGLSGQD